MKISKKDLSLLLVLVAVCALVISSCNKNKLTDFEKFVNNIYNSELKLASYSEVSSINDKGTEVYNKSTLFKLTIINIQYVNLNRKKPYNKAVIRPF